MRIAVDAMGGDYAPQEIVAGAIQAASKLPGLSQVILVGDEAAMKRELRKHRSVPDRVTLRQASEVIDMDEAPALAVRRK